MIYITGLGFGGAEGMSLAAAKMLKSGLPVFLRTEQCGAAEWLRSKNIPYTAFDGIYEDADDFSALNAKICEKLTSEAENGDIVYAVPGSGSLEDMSVAALSASGTDITVIPGAGFASAAAALAAELGSEYSSEQSGFAYVSALDTADFVPDVGRPLIVGEIDTQYLASEVKLRLMQYYPDEHPVAYILLNKNIKNALTLLEIDRQMRYYADCAIYLPAVKNPECFGVYGLDRIIRMLRAPGGCPWDIEQTHESLKRDMIEEAYELTDAIDSGDSDRIIDELGDVLMQVVFHAQLEEAASGRSLFDVGTHEAQKMISRHPHVFGEEKAETSADVLRLWDKQKAEEKGFSEGRSALSDVPRGFPALIRAEKILKRAKNYGFVPEPAKAAEKIIDLLQGEMSADKLGQLLLAAAEIASASGIRAEEALQSASEGFIEKFNR